MSRVNLFVVGAMKSGSTTLHHYLSEHPQIFMSHEKEPGFFVPEIWGDRDEREYKELFSGVTTEKYIGESSTHYTKQPTYSRVADKIYNYNPKSRILYIVRHPIKRAISHYLHNRRDLHLHAERRHILRALQQDAVYTAYSNYAMQISPYFDLFGKGRVMIVSFEMLISDPEFVLREIYEWLGVDISIKLRSEIKANVSPVTYHSVRGFGLLNQLRNSRLWDSLSDFFPKRLKSIGNKLAEKEEKLELDEKTKKQIYSKLESTFKRYVRNLEKLTNHKYTEWEI